MCSHCWKNMATVFRPAMTGYRLTNMNNCKLIWKEGLCDIMAIPALTSVLVSAGQWVNCQPKLSLYCWHTCKFGWIPCGVWLGMCKHDMSVCVCDASCKPLFILHSAELIVICGPHKFVQGNARQSSHLSSFHASLSSSVCVVPHVIMWVCVWDFA